MEQYRGFRVWFDENYEFFDESGGVSGWTAAGANVKPMIGDYVLVDQQVMPYSPQSSTETPDVPRSPRAEDAVGDDSDPVETGQGARVTAQRGRRGAASGEAARAAAARANPLGDKFHDGVATVYTQEDFETALGMNGLTKILIPQDPQESINVVGEAPEGVLIEINSQVDEVDTRASVVVKESGRVNSVKNGEVTIARGAIVENLTGGRATVKGTLRNIRGENARVMVQEGGQVDNVYQARLVHVNNGRIDKVHDGVVTLTGNRTEVEHVDNGQIEMTFDSAINDVAGGNIKVKLSGYIALAASVGVANVDAESKSVSASGLTIDFSEAERFTLVSEARDLIYEIPAE
ncbi:MAG: hypothetical protein H0T78_06965 [Longispora sp.]|nr:hypothetical protein [Longispora sp. (in: high G+C Gram-positive bacteria)]